MCYREWDSAACAVELQMSACGTGGSRRSQLKTSAPRTDCFCGRMFRGMREMRRLGESGSFARSSLRDCAPNGAALRSLKYENEAVGERGMGIVISYKKTAAG